jgi:protocatechuate 3,4-dioxygenase beta subunit
MVPQGTGGIRVFVHHRGRPLPDAEIAILPAGKPKPMVVRTRTDGRQFVAGIPPGSYGLTARHPPEHLHSTLHVEVHAARIHDLTLELRRGCVVHGRVTDRGGTPIQGATVVLLVGAGGTSSQRGTSDEQGHYRITGLPPDHYRTFAKHPRFKRTAGADAPLPAEGDEARIDILMEPGARVAGTVTDEEGRPISGATVTITNILSSTVAKSGADGRFEGGGLEDGPVNLSAMKEGFGIVYIRNAPLNGSEVKLVMPTPGTVTGRLTSTPPAPTFQIVLQRFEPDLKQEVPVYSRHFTAPAEGRFILKDVPPGTYKASLIAGGYVMVGDPVQVVVEKGKTVEGLELRARPEN